MLVIVGLSFAQTKESKVELCSVPIFCLCPFPSFYHILECSSHAFPEVFFYLNQFGVNLEKRTRSDIMTMRDIREDSPFSSEVKWKNSWPQPDASRGVSSNQLSTKM